MSHRNRTYRGYSAQVVTFNLQIVPEAEQGWRDAPGHLSTRNPRQRGNTAPQREIGKQEKAVCRLFLFILLLSLVMLEIGCSHNPIDEALKIQLPRHTVTIDPEGNPVDPVTFTTLSPDSFQRQLNTLITEISKSGKKQILVFVHGGLNHQEASLNRVQELLRDD
ncbi:MAG: hypothetical protein OEY80_11580, partial [Nitrospirota bacterium]|nr:hypothetical protein [Nitrospirota bacterium]